MMSLKGIKLVTFDATNTLLKFKVPPWQHYAVVAREYGFQGSGDDLKERLLDSYKKMWGTYPNFGKNTLNWDHWWKNVVKLTFKNRLPRNTNIDELADRLINEFKTSKCWSRAEGGEKLLKLLRKNGVSSLGVISNFDPRLSDILQSVKIHNNFDFILTSYEIGYSKPDKRIFEHAMNKCKDLVKPFECLHIGDDLRKDYEGAKTAGWHAILVTKSLKTETPSNQLKVFSNLEELNLAIEQNKLNFSF